MTTSDDDRGGRPERRTAALLSGHGRYVADLVTGALHAVVVRSPVAHGWLRGVDTAGAVSSPGVVAVFTARDLRDVPALPIRVDTSEGLERRRQPVIATDRVRYVGQPVAVVVADDPYRAEDAAELVETDIAVLETVTEADGDGVSLWDEPLDNQFFELRVRFGPPPPEQSPGGARTYRIQRHTAVPLETRGLVAEADGHRLQLWGPTKYVSYVRTTLASMLALDPSDVTCHHVDVGGMFGVRGELYPEDVLVAWAACTLQRRVAWIEDRREHFVSINHSRDQAHQLGIDVSPDGRLRRLDDDVVLDAGAYAGAIGRKLAALTLESLPGPYRWDGLHARCRARATNKTPVGVMRGPGTAEATFARERALDIAAAAAGHDPIELRLRNLLRADELPQRLPLGPELADLVYDSGDFAGTARRFTADIGLDGLRAAVRRRRRTGELVGVGCACFVAHSGAGLEETVAVALREDGQFVVGTSANEVGQGLDAMIVAVAAEHLGVPSAQIEVYSGDSRAHAGGNGTFSSRSTMFVGSALVDAARRVTDDVLAELTARWDVEATDITRTRTGFAYRGDEVHWKEFAPREVVGRHAMPEPSWGFGMNVALVRLDVVTAAPTVERLWIGYDCGQVIDREGTRRQLVGASVQALGGALLEELPYDEQGQPIATTLMDYLLPTAHEAPDVQVHIYEAGPAPGNPLGAKGVGEAGMFGVGAAIANAVADALGPAGAGLTSLPVTPAVIAPLLSRSAADRAATRGRASG